MMMRRKDRKIRKEQASVKQLTEEHPCIYIVPVHSGMLMGLIGNPLPLDGSGNGHGRPVPI
jgi:hypothetical protein